MMSKEISSIASYGSPTPTGDKTIEGQLIDPNRPSLDKIRAFTKAEARAANIAEHEQTFLHALSTNKKAVFWSLVISMAIDRTYEELDVLFARKLSARKFKSAEVHVYEDSEYQIFLD
ncbi:hypothetical protein KVR01_006906 [Diaporthe batatas]|uniref:uncharacterized protein n=1 Tax=Diaporthe batatas TaxID=748121 RepID=UPI001D0491DA|nr:uncharacterized protein KVR01_006906 [Diaporthe batatas]KAG8163609.1 hypothetical protein KVR01_006906 [Diaporthe batatas]